MAQKTFSGQRKTEHLDAKRDPPKIGPQSDRFCYIEFKDVPNQQEAEIPRVSKWKSDSIFPDMVPILRIAPLREHRY